ncbi:MAG: glycosyltransferase family 4 protein [Candidatus Omnitrophica bacterium]|nr:glycosyltransferase family 4 protein [Candidatus Omnitrophota bacterium]
MKIAYIYDVIYPYVKGGAEKRFWELAKRLSLKGHEVHVFGMKSWQGEDSFIKEGVHIHGICKRRQLYKKTGLRSLTQVLYFTFHVLPGLWKRKFDIIDCNAFPYLPFFPVRFFSLLKKIPLVVTCQEIWGNYWYSYIGILKGSIASLIERVVISLSGNLIVYSPRIKENLLKLGVSEKNKNIRVIANGVDLENIQERLPGKQNSDLIFVGRLIKEKNVDVLIKAVALIKKSFSQIKCIIVGGGPEKKNLTALSEKLNLNENILFTDFLENEEAISLMKASKVFIFPSAREGFGIAVLEAMACGLPVIVIDYSLNAACELIQERQNGFVCKDGQEMVKRIVELLENENLRLVMSGLAKAYARNYDWDEIAKESEKFYNYVFDNFKNGKRT